MPSRKWQCREWCKGAKYMGWAIRQWMHVLWRGFNECAYIYSKSSWQYSIRNLGLTWEVYLNCMIFIITRWRHREMPMVFHFLGPKKSLSSMFTHRCAGSHTTYIAQPLAIANITYDRTGLVHTWIRWTPNCAAHNALISIFLFIKFRACAHLLFYGRSGAARWCRYIAKKIHIYAVREWSSAWNVIIEWQQVEEDDALNQLRGD